MNSIRKLSRTPVKYMKAWMKASGMGKLRLSWISLSIGRLLRGRIRPRSRRVVRVGTERMNGKERVPAGSEMGECERVEGHLGATQALVVFEAPLALPQHDDQTAPQHVTCLVLERLPELGLAGVSHHARLLLLQPAVAVAQVALHIGIGGSLARGDVPRTHHLHLQLALGHQQPQLQFYRSGAWQSETAGLDLTGSQARGRRALGTRRRAALFTRLGQFQDTVFTALAIWGTACWSCWKYIMCELFSNLGFLKWF